MSLFSRILGKAGSSKPRTRICIECGMPPANHKEWCAILKGELERKAREAAPAQPPQPSA